MSDQSVYVTLRRVDHNGETFKRHHAISLTTEEAKPLLVCNAVSDDLTIVPGLADEVDAAVKAEAEKQAQTEVEAAAKVEAEKKAQAEAEVAAKAEAEKQAQAEKKAPAPGKKG